MVTQYVSPSAVTDFIMHGERKSGNGNSVLYCVKWLISAGNDIEVVYHDSESGK